jgi:signal transduction histidine kinase/ActR/RegA family two-component response regulator
MRAKPPSPPLQPWQVEELQTRLQEAEAALAAIGGANGDPFAGYRWPGDEEEESTPGNDYSPQGELTGQGRPRQIAAADMLARAALMQASEALVVCDNQDLIVLANDAAHALGTGNLIGAPFARAFPLVSEPGGMPLPPPGPGSSLERSRREVTYGREGQIFLLLLGSAPLFGDANELLGRVVTLADITQRKRTEDLLTQAERRKDEFLATLAHELRNPLAPIRSAAEWLRKVSPASGETDRALDMLDWQVRQLTHLVDDLLDVSRISQGKIVLRKKPLLLNEVVAHAVETASAFIESRQHRLELSLPGKPIWINGDEMRLTQVLVNLLNNAAKYMDEGGQVELAARACANGVIIQVRDRGIGIPEAMLSRVFDLFAQGDCPTDRHQHGLGIGLTLVQNLVMLHGGLVEAVSNGIGQGSEFTVRLPIIEPPRPAKSVAPAAGAPERSLRILAVDDNLDSAVSMAMLLQLQGHRVDTAGTGPAAIAAALALQPDVVLLDIGLPGMDGYEVAQRLREMPQTRSAVLVALTGYGQPQDRQRSHEAGFDHHLVKPVELASINRILASVATGAR